MGFVSLGRGDVHIGLHVVVRGEQTKDLVKVGAS